MGAAWYIHEGVPLSEVVKFLNRRLGVAHAKTAPYSPQSNGACDEEIAVVAEHESGCRQFRSVVCMSSSQGCRPWSSWLVGDDLLRTREARNKIEAHAHQWSPAWEWLH